MNDKGSQIHCAKVQVQGVPAFGNIDSGTDITITGSSLFRKVATVALLKKRDFRKADKMPLAYDQQPFSTIKWILTTPLESSPCVPQLQLSSHQSAVAQVRADRCGGGGPVYMEHDPHLEDETGLCTDDALLQPNEESCT